MNRSAQVNNVIRDCKIYFASTVLITSQFLLMPSRIHAGPVDANGNELPDPNDGKSTVKAPPIVQGCAAPSDTEFRIGIPGWMSGLEGDVGVRGIIAPVDVRFTDILDKLDQIPIVLSAYFRYHRWEIFGDGQYLKLSDSVTLPDVLFSHADLELKSAFVEGFVGYRLINCENATMSIFAGARYNYMSIDLQIFDNGDPRFPIIRQRLGIPANLNVSGSKEWVDPVVGAGGRVRIWKPVSLWAKGDIGGFGAASDFTWQVQGGLEFQVTRWLYSDIGWRYMKFDYTSGGFTNKTELNGPFIETGIKF